MAPGDLPVDDTVSLGDPLTRRGLIGEFGFDSAGDATRAPVAIVRARRAGGAHTAGSIEGADVVRVIDVPAALLR